MSEDVRQNVGVAGVVANEDGHILLIRTKKAGWELPGGKVERGEDLITALQREVLEETYCDVEVGRLTGVISYLSRPGVTRPGVTSFTFLCQYIGGTPYPGDDSLEVGWFAPKTAVQIVTHPTEQIRLKDALSEDQSVKYRSCQGTQTDGYKLLRFHRC